MAQIVKAANTAAALMAAVQWRRIQYSGRRRLSALRGTGRWLPCNKYSHGSLATINCRGQWGPSAAAGIAGVAERTFSGLQSAGYLCQKNRLD